MNRVQQWIRDNAFSLFLFLAVFLLEFRFYYRTSDDQQLLTDFQSLYDAQTFSNVLRQVGTKIAADVAGWSSRVVINVFANFLVFYVGLWAVCNSLVTVLFHVQICRLFGVKGNKERLLILVFMLLTPIEIYRSCGWIVGTVSYYWPVVFVFTAFTILCRKTYLHSRRSLAAMIICMVYACNEEIICIFAFLGLWVWLFLLHREDKKIVLQLQCVTVAELLWILFCPGNWSRLDREPARWFPRFEELSVIHKMEMGFTSTMNRFWLRTCPVSAALGIVLLTLVLLRKRNPGIRALGAVPLAAALAGWYIKEHASTDKICSWLYYSEGQYGSVGLYSYQSPASYLPLLFYVCIGGLILVLILDVGDYSRAAIAHSLVLLIAVASRCIMGFTPTIWVSARRTYSLLYWVQVLLLYEAWRQIRREDPERRYSPLCLTGLGLCAAYGLMDLMKLL